MADYWKSQAKKFCDFCKCWIADNKPSIEFHEKGKRHRENVAKRISEISKKSRQEHKAALKVDDEMKKMEEIMHCKRCSVPGCETKAWVPFNNISLFRFPKDKIRCAAWVELINNPVLYEKSLEQLYQLRVCANHFTADQFMNYRRNRLIHCALPSLQLPSVHSYFPETQNGANKTLISITATDDAKVRVHAALKAYMKDVEANADYSSQLIREQLEQKQKDESLTQIFVKSETAESSDPPVKKEPDADVSVKAEPEVDLQPKTESETSAPKLWYEAKSDEGYKYYWHIETGESRWDPPEEGFMSLKEQKKAEVKESQKKAEEERQKKLEKERQEEEERARLEREKMKSRRIKEEKPPSPPSPVETTCPVIGPAPRTDPYGIWKPVEKRELEPIDWQLPQQEYIEIKVPSIVEPPPEHKFKEKTVKSLGAADDMTGTCFKKRKFNSSCKRNMRQRLDEDA